MCCCIQKQQSAQPQPWRQFGGVEEPCVTANKVYAVAGSFLAACAVVGVVWGGCTLYASAWGQDSALLTRAFSLFGGSGAAALLSTIAWTCLCINNAEEHHDGEVVV